MSIFTKRELSIGATLFVAGGVLVVLMTIPSKPAQVPSPVAASAAPPARPPPSAAPSAAPSAKPEPWAYVTRPSELIGRWVDAQYGDAIPKGPGGGTIVDHGVRMEFREGKKKTPFNLTFWAPRDGHMTSATIAGGCGFYPPEPGVG